MIATLPAGHDSRAIRNHNPFPHDAVTISCKFTSQFLVCAKTR